MSTLVHASPSTLSADLPLSRARGWTVAVVATLAMTVSYIDRQALAALAPTVRAALAIDQTHYGWLTGAFSISYLLGAPLAGALLDRTGSRVGLTIAVVLWSIVAGLHALAPTFAVLFALRVGLGVTEAPSFPGAAQAVRRVLRGRDRATAYGLLFTGSSVGAMIAGPAAIALKIHGGFRLAFVGVACVGALWIPLWLLVTSGRAGRTLDPSRAHESDDVAHAPSDAAPSDAAEATRPASLRTSLELLGRTSVLRALLLVVGSAPAILFVLSWFPQYLVGVHGIHQDDLGRFVWSPPLFFDLGAVGLAALAARRPSPRGPSLHLLLAALAASALVLLPLASRLGPPGNGGAWIATCVAGVAMFGGGGVYSLLTADMLARVPAKRVSVAGGLTAAAQSLAHVVGAPLIGRSIDHSGGYAHACVVVGLLVLPAAAVWILWGRSPALEPRLER